MASWGWRRRSGVRWVMSSWSTEWCPPSPGVLWDREGFTVTERVCIYTAPTQREQAQHAVKEATPVLPEVVDPADSLPTPTHSLFPPFQLPTALLQLPPFPTEVLRHPRAPGAAVLSAACAPTTAAVSAATCIAVVGDRGVPRRRSFGHRILSVRANGGGGAADAQDNAFNTAMSVRAPTRQRRSGSGGGGIGRPAGGGQELDGRIGTTQRTPAAVAPTQPADEGPPAASRCMSVAAAGPTVISAVPAALPSTLLRP